MFDINFTGSDLNDIHFKYCGLAYAKFSKSECNIMMFGFCELSCSYFSGANLDLVHNI